MEGLGQVYLGNKVQNWLIAVTLLVVAMSVLSIARRVGISRLSALAMATDNEIDDLLVAILTRTKSVTLLLASGFVASHALTLTPPVMAASQTVVVLVLIVQGGLWGTAGISFWLARMISRRKDRDASTATTISLLGFVARLVLWVIVLLLVLDNLGVNITGLLAGLGIGGIAVALAVQNVLGDLLASLSIVLDKPFVIGDFVVVDSLSGTVEHIGLKTTRIRSLSGEQLILANNDLLKSRIRNYKRMDERRISFGFGVVYQTSLGDLKLIKEMVTDIITKQENARLDRVHFKEFADSSLNFEVIYYVATPDYNVYMDVQEAINLEMVRRFEERNIEFAYPTRTIHVEREAI